MEVWGRHVWRDGVQRYGFYLGICLLVSVFSMNVFGCVASAQEGESMPVVQYSSPGYETVFRSADNPVRLRIDDTSKQFKSVNVTIDGAVYTVARDACTTEGETAYILCDVNSASNWEGLSQGRHGVVYTVINTLDEEVFRDDTPREFIIDDNAPEVSSLQVTMTEARHLEVIAQASATRGIASIDVYVIPANGGDCTSAASRIVERSVPVDETGGIATTIDMTAQSAGSYCVAAVARDNTAASSNYAYRPIQLAAPITPVPTTPTPPKPEPIIPGNVDDIPLKLIPFVSLTFSDPETNKISPQRDMSVLQNFGSVDTSDTPLLQESPLSRSVAVAATPQSSTGGVITATQTGWRLLSIEWYWWIGIVGGIVVFWRFVVTLFKRRLAQDEPSFLG